MRGLIPALLCMMLAGSAHAAVTDVTGDWSTEDHKGVIRVAPCDGGFCGTIVGMTDFDPNYLGQSQCHEVILHVAARPAPDGRRPASVTDPRNGAVYDAQLWRGADGALRLRGFVGLPLFGSTQRWEPYAGKVRADCHFPG